jgi:MEMO1 family protein
MQAVLIVLLSIFTCMETLAQNLSSDRKPFAAGRFYPDDKETLTKDLAALFENCKKTPGSSTVRAIISPHAGYVFSGKISAAAFAAIPKNASYKNIFIIGSSHVKYFNGASVYNTGDYITPLGRVHVNRQIADKLKENKVFDFPTDAHVQEHSIENQIPFIQYYFKEQPAIVPIIIGTNDEGVIKAIAEALRPWFLPENLFVISSDFSHYPAYDDAVKTDHLTAEGIISGNSKTFLGVLSKNEAKNINNLATSMCGWTSGLTLLYLTEGNRNIEIKLIDYCNSGDSKLGGKNEVVGYNAIGFFEKQNGNANETSLSITKDEKKQLFDIVRKTLDAKFSGKSGYVINESAVSENLRNPYGAFVTLKISGSLRGCIGRFVSSEPLYKVVQESALSSAFQDPRFNPLTKEEYPRTQIEITVLGPLKKITDIKEIVLGKHGIYIKKGQQSGTMLPQVAIENKWTVEEFLGYTSREKAGLGWDGWKNAEIFIYEGLVLEE